MVKALIVEDEEEARDISRENLEKRNFEIVAVATASEALTALKKNSDVDIFLLDLALGGGMDGWQLCQNLRERREFAETPIFAITANGFAEVCNEATDNGFTACYMKPVDYDKLASDIRYSLNA